MNAPATGSAVLYEARGAVALLTLNRPEALNSFTRAMHQDLWAALDRAEADPAVRALVFTGAGRGFCRRRVTGRWCSSMVSASACTSARSALFHSAMACWISEPLILRIEASGPIA